MSALPDDAIVVRGGQNLPENFAQGSGVHALALVLEDLAG
jgi:hypothetical protein